MVGVIIIDFVTGTAKAIKTKDVSSSTGLYGLMKHSIILIMVMFLAIVSIVLDVVIIGYAFTLFYVFEYAISILENLDILGIKFPEPMRKMLRQWQEQNNDRWGV